MVNLRGWRCNKTSGCLSGEIPCGLKASMLSQQTAAAKKGGDCYAIGEQAIELLFYLCFTYFSCPQINTLVICQ